MMAARTGYRWHLRRPMADQDMYATTQLGPLLAERGITLSRGAGPPAGHRDPRAAEPGYPGRAVRHPGLPAR